LASYKSRQQCPECHRYEATIATVHGQDIVRCMCGRFLYCAPRGETGRKDGQPYEAPVVQAQDDRQGRLFW
jgi:hypothetical protein